MKFLWYITVQREYNPTPNENFGLEKVGGESISLAQPTKNVNSSKTKRVQKRLLMVHTGTKRVQTAGIIEYIRSAGLAYDGGNRADWRKLCDAAIGLNACRL